MLERHDVAVIDAIDSAERVIELAGRRVAERAIEEPGCTARSGAHQRDARPI